MLLLLILAMSIYCCPTHNPQLTVTSTCYRAQPYKVVLPVSVTEETKQPAQEQRAAKCEDTGRPVLYDSSFRLSVEFISGIQC